MGGLRHQVGLAVRRLRGLPPPEVPFGSVGEPARTFPMFEIGPHTYGPIQVFRETDEHTLRIGDYCSLGKGTAFWIGEGHRTDWVTTYPFSVVDERFRDIKGHPVSKGDIVVGSDVWIGWQSVIMSGVTIGHGAVVGARSMVTKDVPPYTIVAGSPARVIRQRFDDATIARLLEIAWWEWDEASVAAAVPFMLSDDISAFIAEVDTGRLPLAF